ncbi:hypothetical protein LTR16_008387, partial [Cryomyces antarcticus]
MSPLANAVSFVDGNSRELTLLVNYTKNASEVVHSAILWGHIEKSGEWVAAFEIVKDGGPNGGSGGAIDSGHFDVRGTKARNLIVLSVCEDIVSLENSVVNVDRKLPTVLTCKGDKSHHECQEWRYNYGDWVTYISTAAKMLNRPLLTAKIQHGWQLEAQALAERRGSLKEDIVAFEDCIDDLSLDRSITVHQRPCI